MDVMRHLSTQCFRAWWWWLLTKCSSSFFFFCNRDRDRPWDSYHETAVVLRSCSLHCDHVTCLLACCRHVGNATRTNGYVRYHKYLLTPFRLGSSWALVKLTSCPEKNNVQLTMLDLPSSSIFYIIISSNRQLDDGPHHFVVDSNIYVWCVSCELS
jgi:hypothetical protein